MPIQQLSLVYRHFDHINDDPFIGIHSSTPICYSPTPENSFEGIVLSKSIKWTRYIIWVRDHYAPYQRKDLEVVLVVALRIPTGDKIPPRVFPTSVLNLEVIDAVQGKRFSPCDKDHLIEWEQISTQQSVKSIERDILHWTRHCSGWKDGLGGFKSGKVGGMKMKSLLNMGGRSRNSQCIARDCNLKCSPSVEGITG
ncbi:hypothetical protein BS47DRAFT_1362086 [Hydnum rufescens UP504]|uniref:Uncharacterized protein n=1 Tax=Hydnum rufescens UP504 TaxID=1448309 RepID=A0A9P6DWP3_9AGAM|nr:hypothetical protein BS47DRAFT_1362086 [Hydnum rufescens UP504]